MVRRNEVDRCPDCGSDEVITVRIVVGDHALRFLCCHLCGAKRWERGGEPVALESVLDLVATR